MPVLFEDIDAIGFNAENGSSTDCSVIADEKLSARTALEGTTGTLLSENVASEPIIPIRIKMPRTIARSEPTKVPATIFRKFFILYVVLFQVTSQN
jgi:hypothetical protein